jgi:pyruvate formate lyase activating enzyme
MLIGGLQKTTLIDFPGRVACTVFTVGCNFRCPFCHNKDLVTLTNFKKSGIKPILEKDFFAFLASRKKILDGVCITGGEPTIHPDLEDFCSKIKKLDLEVKLDTNGSNPQVLKRLLDKKLIDFVAMDVKATFSDYAKAVLKCKDQNEKCEITEQNSKLIKNIKKSIKIILELGLEYEFRTTVVPGIHSKEIMVKLAGDLKGIIQQCNNVTMEQFKYVLQKFRPQNCLDPEYLKIKPYTDKQMDDILRAVRKILPNTRIRGED